MTRVVLTGATGFIGRHLLNYLASDMRLQLVVVVRRPIEKPLPSNVTVVNITDFRQEHAWESVLRPDDTVVHLAGLAHRDLPTDSQVEGYFEANVATTRAIAIVAARRSIKRLIFISSIGVYGSSRDDVVTPCSSLHPDQPYAESKLAAELAIMSTPGRTYDSIILRLPLVYGADAPGNFGRLLRLVGLGIPLPFSALHNRKSFLAISTLNEIIHRFIYHPDRGDHTLIAAESESVSLAELLKNLSKGMKTTSLMFYLPHWLLKLMLTVVGQKKMYRKLCLTLETDSSDVFRLLNWKPNNNSEHLIRQIGVDYRRQTKG